MAARRVASATESSGRLPSESALVESFRKAFASRDTNVVRVGIGDDAAVVQLPKPLVWTIDDSVEGVHFDRRWLSLAQAAARAFQAALSDVAAMGAMPLCALSSLQVPPTTTSLELRAIRSGQRQAARTSRCPIVGGNVTRGDVFRFTTTLLGHTRFPVLRTSAKPGHELWLLGEVGLAGCGRNWLVRGLPQGRGALSRAVSTCVRAWRVPKARIEDGLLLDGRRHAAIDVSDGLATECNTLARASDARVEVDEALLRGTLGAALVAAAAGLGRDPLEFALSGGEDYALLASGPRATRPQGAKVIGRVAKGEGAVIVSSRRSKPLTGGFDHLRG